MPSKLEAQLIHLVVAQHIRILTGDSPVMQALRRRARKGVFADVLVGRAFLNAADEARTGAAMQRELLIVGQLLIDAERIQPSIFPALRISAKRPSP